jgi:hypothetical protein
MVTGGAKRTGEVDLEGEADVVDMRTEVAGNTKSAVNKELKEK